jgi:hypothetical protein
MRRRRMPIASARASTWPTVAIRRSAADSLPVPRPGASSDAPGLGGRPQPVKVKYFQEPFVVEFTVSPEELLM